MTIPQIYKRYGLDAIGFTHFPYFDEFLGVLRRLG